MRANRSYLRLGSLPFVAALLMSSAASIFATDEPVTVYLKTPIEDAERQQLEAVLRALPSQQAKWREFANRSIEYVIRQGSVGMFEPDPCEHLPIRVKVVHGRLASAVYDSSGGRCKRGQAASRKSPDGRQRHLLPDELFERIAMNRDELRCYEGSGPEFCLATTLNVIYDEKLGLPTKIEDFSNVVSDHYWSLEVMEIKLGP